MTKHHEVRTCEHCEITWDLLFTGYDIECRRVPVEGPPSWVNDG